MNKVNEFKQFLENNKFEFIEIVKNNDFSKIIKYYNSVECFTLLMEIYKNSNGFDIYYLSNVNDIDKLKDEIIDKMLA